MKSRRRNDIILILLFIIISVIISLFIHFRHEDGMYACVYVDNVLTGRYPLNINETVRINGYLGGTNVLSIEDGYARMTGASCPDGLCINQGAVNGTGQSIICLPNRVVVKITGQEDDGYDAYTQ
ncbi:MAG: NusG domain II-containing protein [Lachnospiraceae bacterium]|nr:NusG domain II-containing protein [Lachnospiraceae bacterium]